MAGQANYDLLAERLFHTTLDTTTDTSFEVLFGRLMTYAEPGFAPVRLSADHGADGLDYWSGKLYACYGSTTADPYKAIAKFRKDFESACRQRPGEFSEFVFVHNDAGGSHPDLTHAIAQAALAQPSIKITNWGRGHLTTLFLDLEQHQQERVIGRDMDAVLLSRVGITEVADLLENLAEPVSELDPDDMGSLPLPNPEKLDFNEITGLERRWLQKSWKHTSMVRDYYALHRDPLAAEALGSRYRRLRSDGLVPNKIVENLRIYVTGSATSAEHHLASYIVLAYFLERCHIFENPPADFAMRGG
ncbi:ABC-three component system protein [Glycomyces arizonensis]|uniref:ABC-three component system protein n=1 Tax=Glycomyces arizonensis TaxID=256035 RepID=UPI000407280B|nr:ABC-three component system protein [Glycomyces arizonensis]